MEPSATGDEIADRLLFDLDQAMRDGKLRGLPLAQIVHQCYRTLGPLQVVAEYDFGGLENAILLASELLTEAADLIARGKDGKQEVVSAITIVVVRFSQTLEPSNSLKALLAAMVRQIAVSPEIGGVIGWHGQSMEELYRHSLWAKTPIDADVSTILDRHIDI